MKAFLFRSEGLGKKSCDAISKKSKYNIPVFISKHDVISPDFDLCIRWGSIGKQPVAKVLNKKQAIKKTVNKGDFRQVLQEARLCPYTWGSSWGEPKDVAALVIRPPYHQKGEDFYICENQREADSAISNFEEGWYATEFIDKVAEYRINVLQGRVLCVIEKTPKDKNDLIWGRGKTSIVKWSAWPLQGVSKSLEALALSELDFAGVDVIQDKEGKCYVLELNTSPFLEGEYQQECFAKGFDYVIENGKAVVPLNDGVLDWKKFIHPAISKAAKV